MIERLRFWLDHRWTPRHMSAYLDGDLPGSERQRFEHHVHDCPKCREILRSLRSLLSSLAGLRQPPEQDREPTVVPEVLAGVRAELKGDGSNDRGA